MARVIEFLILGETEVQARIAGVADRIQAEIVKALNTVNTQLQRHIVSDKLSGQVLKSHTGNLKRAILQIPAEVDGGEITGGVGLGTEAKYGLAHEYGAEIPERRPVTAKALSWIGQDGARVFAMYAKAFTLPERSFMRTGFAEFRDRIETAIREAVERGAALA